MINCLSLVVFFISYSTSYGKSTQLFLSKQKIYEDDFFRVDNVFTKDNQHIRLFGPSNVSADGITHGFISLENENHIVVPYIKLMLSGLYLQPTRSPKSILMIGLGISILPRAFNQIILKDSHIDVVEIDERTLDLAQKYFFLKKSPLLNVIIDDGFDYLMNLTSEKYDMIILDAFMEVSQKSCAPDTFLTERFVLKVRERLNSKGVFVINTLPQFCSKFQLERNLYHSIFGRIYMESFYSNTVLIALKGKAPTQRQIESRISYYKKVFKRVGTDGHWLVQMFNSFKRYKKNALYKLHCDMFLYTFLDNTCSN